MRTIREFTPFILAVAAVIIFMSFMFWSLYTAQRDLEASIVTNRVALDLWMSDCAGQHRPIDDCTFQWDRNGTLRTYYRGKAVQE